MHGQQNIKKITKNVFFSLVYLFSGVAEVLCTAWYAGEVLL